MAKTIACITFFALTLISLTAQTTCRTIYIIVHGTWSYDAAWYQPGGDFFEELKKSAQLIDASVISFTWSGKNLHESRMQAAQKLCTLMQSYSSDYEINLVTHSHGSNVGTLASQIMHNALSNKKNIHTFFALGTPINEASYMPNMNVIKHFYNLFSFSDLIQPVLGMFKRELPSHERIANIRITINELEPTHTQLHDPLIARWIPFIDSMPNFNQTQIFKKPGILHFSKSPPQFAFDYEREKLRENDQKLMLMLATVPMHDRPNLKIFK